MWHWKKIPIHNIRLLSFQQYWGNCILRFPHLKVKNGGVEGCRVMWWTPCNPRELSMTSKRHFCVRRKVCTLKVRWYLGDAVAATDGGLHRVTPGASLLLQRHRLVNELARRQLESLCRWEFSGVLDENVTQEKIESLTWLVSPAGARGQTDIRAPENKLSIHRSDTLLSSAAIILQVGDGL